VAAGLLGCGAGTFETMPDRHPRLHNQNQAVWSSGMDSSISEKDWRSIPAYRKMLADKQYQDRWERAAGAIVRIDPDNGCDQLLAVRTKDNRTSVDGALESAYQADLSSRILKALDTPRGHAPGVRTCIRHGALTWIMEHMGSMDKEQLITTIERVLQTGSVLEGEGGQEEFVDVDCQKDAGKLNWHLLLAMHKLRGDEFVPRLIEIVTPATVEQAVKVVRRKRPAAKVDQLLLEANSEIRERSLVATAAIEIARPELAALRYATLLRAGAPEEDVKLGTALLGLEDTRTLPDDLRGRVELGSAKLEAQTDALPELHRMIVDLWIKKKIGPRAAPAEKPAPSSKPMSDTMAMNKALAMLREFDQQVKILKAVVLFADGYKMTVAALPHLEPKVRTSMLILFRNAMKVHGGKVLATFIDDLKKGGTLRKSAEGALLSDCAGNPACRFAAATLIAVPAASATEWVTIPALHPKEPAPAGQQQ
jgi:hypothetical protein